MKSKLEEFIDNHSEELDHRTPNPEVLNRIMRQMGHEHSPQQQAQEKKGIVISFRAMRWAAAACVLIALSFGLWQYQASQNKVEDSIARVPHKVQPSHTLPDTAVTEASKITSYKPQSEKHRFDEVDEDIARRKNRIAENLNGAEPAAYEKVLFDKLNNEASPASRIRALSHTNKMRNLSNDVVDVLVETMNNDSNTSVRLAALEGLTKFYKEGYVRKQLIKSLKKQKDPMVQIALIGLLTRMKESAILTELEGLVKDENNMDAVRETAYTGMYELRSL